MDPRRPMCRETEEAGLGRRGGPTGWNPLPPGGAVGRQEGQALVTLNPLSLTPPVVHPHPSCVLPPASSTVFSQPPTKATMLYLAQNIPQFPFKQLLVRTQLHLYTQKPPSLICLLPADPPDQHCTGQGYSQPSPLFPLQPRIWFSLISRHWTFVTQSKTVKSDSLNNVQLQSQRPG